MASYSPTIPGLTKTNEIQGQSANNAASYCYLFEPLRVIFTENSAAATKLYVHLQVTKTDGSSYLIANLPKYAEYDLPSSGSVSIDLMKIAQQYHDANVYKFAEVQDFDSAIGAGWKAVVSQYRYTFKISTDKTTATLDVVKIPIIGGRAFQDFVPSVTNTNEITEAGVLDIDLTNRWKDYPMITQTLAVPTSTNATPTVSVQYSSLGTKPCGGMLIWKSRLGGWMYWGFDLKKESQQKTYTGNIPVGLFESTGPAGNAYIPTSYTGIETSNTVTLKSLGLSSNELRAVQSILASPAVYYMADSDGGVDQTRIELMKVTSATAPLDNLANGGDFTVSLSSISTSSQKVR